MDKDNNVTTPSPLADPSQVEALRHPGDIDALRQPGSVVELPGPETDTTPPGPPEIEVTRPSGPWPTARAASYQVTEFSAGQAKFATHEAACELVRQAVVLPQMAPAWEATRDLHRLLRQAQNVVHVWADVPTEELGEITHAQSGTHAAIMNVSGFAAQAAEMLDRAVSKPSQWAATFEAIMSEATKHRAYRLMGMVAGALLAGPFTETWDNAVAWCIAFWGARW